MVQRIASSLRLENDSAPAGEGWWTWSVWVEGSPVDLASVESVTYRLHPTFPKPVVRVTNREDKFRLTSSGWGEFSVSADVRTDDGRTVRLERWLQLSGSGGTSTRKPRPSVFVSHSVADNNVARELEDALKAQGIEVCTAEQTMDPGDEWAGSIERQLEKADAVVALVSDPHSSFVEQEALTALDLGRYVLPVTVKGATLQGKLSRIARFDLADSAGVRSLADQIAARVLDRVIDDA
jgi:TIR domain/YEATS family